MAETSTSGVPYEQYENETQQSQLKSNSTHQVVRPGEHVIQPFQVQTVAESRSFDICSLVTAMISTCCCTVFGFIATVMAILSYVDHSVNQFERSKAKRNVAYCFGIAGIVIGVLTVIITIVIVMTVVHGSYDQVEQYPGLSIN